jgi:hypothetical protein
MGKSDRGTDRGKRPTAPIWLSRFTRRNIHEEQHEYVVHIFLYEFLLHGNTLIKNNM